MRALLQYGMLIMLWGYREHCKVRALYDVGICIEGACGNHEACQAA
jgi:hypothetical protein